MICLDQFLDHPLKKRRSVRLSSFPSSPCPRWNSVESVCSPFIPAPDPAALFEYLTTIVETTNVHFNAIGDAIEEGLGENRLGDRMVFARLCTRLADRSHGSGYKDPES